MDPHNAQSSSIVIDPDLLSQIFLPRGICDHNIYYRPSPDIEWMHKKKVRQDPSLNFPVFGEQVGIATIDYNLNTIELKIPRFPDLQKNLRFHN